MVTSSRLTLSGAVCATLASLSRGEDLSALFRVEAEVLANKMPSPLSDHTATLVGTKVYIAGGCDDPNGNSWNQDGKAFYCGSVSQKLFVFDLVEGTFETLADMPAERYRHAAAAAGGKLWITGGRSLFDDLMTDVLAYDFEANTWTSFGGVDESYIVSDHTAFSYQNYAYFAGGYEVNYTAVTTTFRIDADATDMMADSPVIEDRAPLHQSRGDVGGAAQSNYAIVAGGFTHENNFREPLVQAESYSFANDEWTLIANMTYARGDKTLVSIGDSIFALGGERQLADREDAPEPGERTIVIDKVERYDVDVDKWSTLADLPDGHRFRFAGVGYLDKMYTFGGQERFDVACNCFKTSDEVTTYEEVQNGDSGAWNVAFSASMAALVAAATLVLV
uniref:Attractin/MKLN-like beta-propeller domain-containing protein n=1 Tax=Entomoneis paludosa TaxID=265537 RepID=A0A7S2VCZ5_9STRA|mmetsp:Transcript_16640/g.34324  ORF Transcript_16640/g.34324 Transcript_16640/m.34324 type:complete len:393 (+) Transcript_16640:91-1269(+)